jgi:2-isopropylmalate synthase
MDAQTGLEKLRRFSGSGSDNDIVTSSARAYVSALNKMLSWTMRRNMLQQETQKEEDTSSNIGDAQPFQSPVNTVPMS